ncbi:hypothetical protein ACIPSE_43535 [Streptomyces sp. NPDC090106]|uniref:hypothetical protein n=1 Tax=Streptomyces sp. NPDC090106 TaxID=3365946 RepID=UPI0037F47263
MTARRTLHHIAHRLHNNPRLADLAADQLHSAADALATPDHLARACAQLARLGQPAVVSPTPSRTLIRVLDNVDPDHDRPARLLERHHEHRRVQALTALASNPNTPHTAVADILDTLHPAELAWIAEKAGGPDWFLAAAAAVPVPEDEDDGVVRLVDDELRKHPDPAAVLQSWLNSPATEEITARCEVYRAVVKSRYRTLNHLRQIPADEVLTSHEPDVTLKILLDRCERSTHRWETLAATMTFAYDDEKITFGEYPAGSRGCPRGANSEGYAAQAAVGPLPARPPAVRRIRTPSRNDRVARPARPPATVTHPREGCAARP